MIVHKATLVRESGEVSALCFKSPRAISLKSASWTIRDEAVTCKRCLASLKDTAVARHQDRET